MSCIIVGHKARVREGKQDRHEPLPSFPGTGGAQIFFQNNKIPTTPAALIWCRLGSGRPPSIGPENNGTLLLKHICTHTRKHTHTHTHTHTHKHTHTYIQTTKSHPTAIA